MSWVKPSHIAELVEVDNSTVWRWCHRDDSPLPHAKIGDRIIRISTKDFWSWWRRDYRKSRVEKIVEFKAG